jgi:hypothetical protein
MLALVGAGMANSPSPTMLSVIAKIVPTKLNHLAPELREFLSKHAPLIVPFMVIVLCQGLILTRPSCPAYRASSSARDACEHGSVSVVAFGHDRPGTGNCAVSTVDFLNGYGPRNWHAPVCCKTIDFEERGKKGDADLSVSL